MRLPGRHSLRVAIPLLFVSFAMVFSTFYFVVRWKRDNRQIERSGIGFLASQLTLLQGMLEEEVSRQNWSGVAQQVSAFGANPNFRLLLLLDDNNVVIASNHREWVGKATTGMIPEYDYALAESCRENMTGKLRLSGDKSSVTGYYPVMLDTLLGEIRPSRVGLLYVSYDLFDLKASSRRDNLYFALSVVVAFSLMTVTLGLILRTLVTKRLARISASAGRISAGDYTATAEVGGDDEIAQLADSFNRMADKILEDITDRRLAEEALVRSEERFRVLYESSRDAIMIVTPDEGFLSGNKATIEMFGCRNEQEFISLSPADASPEFQPDGRRSVDKAQEMMRLGLEKGSHFFEWTHKRMDGTEFHANVLLTKMELGGRALLQATVRDITERKRSEAESEKLEAQLQQAQKMEAVGRLAGGVAHDFNNLLTVITGYSELLLQKVGKESPMHGEVKEIMRAGERAASLTQQLLAFSRKQIIEPKVIHLGNLVAEMHKMLPRLIGEDISVQIVTGKSLGSVKVDPGQFQQILMNLAVNARDAMPEGGMLLIETANVELNEEYCAQHSYEIHPGRYVRLAVSDTGHGMSEETRKQIFEPFFTTKEKGKGTGLGLSMVYGAVKQSGGSIEVYSEVGKGTTFKIYLPIVEGDVAKPRESKLAVEPPTGSETVLLVEDDAMLRNLCVGILDRLGYKVLQAGNGDEAISLAAGYGERIDLLLTDVVMPGMNGSELATQLVLYRPEMKVLFMSGYTDDAISRHEVLDEGVSFIGKPYTPLALARKVREVLDKA